MHIICLTPLEEGVYNDHSADHIKTVPDGWAMIPDGFRLPATFPRLGSIEAQEMTYTKDGLDYTVMTVTAMTDGVLPDHTQTIDCALSTDERVAALESALAQTDEALIEIFEMIGG